MGHRPERSGAEASPDMLSYAAAPGEQEQGGPNAVPVRVDADRLPGDR